MKLITNSNKYTQNNWKIKTQQNWGSWLHYSAECKNSTFYSSPLSHSLYHIDVCDWKFLLADTMRYTIPADV